MPFDFNTRFFLDQNNKEDLLCLCLSCSEQYLYFSLKAYPVDSFSVFCDDINLCYHPERKRITRNSLFPVYPFFFIQKQKQPEQPLQVIDEILAKGKIAVLSTSFNLLEPYVWYDQNTEELHIGHNMGIIQSDPTYYYFVESPLVIQKEWSPFCEENPCIFRIEREKIAYACQFYCCISEITVRKEQLRQVESLPNKIAGMISSYYNTEKKEGCYTGKKALEVLRQELSENPDSIKMEFFQHHFSCHLIYSRHLIFQKCLEKQEEYRKNPNFFHTMEAVEKAGNSWLSFKEGIIEEVYGKGFSDYQKELLAFISDIQKAEENLMVQLEKLQSLS